MSRDWRTQDWTGVFVSERIEGEYVVVTACHGNDPRFWMPSNVACSLLAYGVTERIEQYLADTSTVNT